MHLMPKGHLLSEGRQRGKARRSHWRRRDWQIDDSEARATIVPQSVAVPLAPGSVVFFDSCLPHGTPANHSQHARKALQVSQCLPHSECTRTGMLARHASAPCVHRSYSWP
jgi:ectoine hydroxylase-related dioxygenase (phytanoyl-CoA dioxygenase family)